jgi:hypothetical protein
MVIIPQMYSLDFPCHSLVATDFMLSENEGRKMMVVYSMRYFQ